VRGSQVCLLACALLLSGGVGHARAEDKTPELLTQQSGSEAVVGGEGSFVTTLGAVVELSQRPPSEDQAIIDRLTKERNQLPTPYLYELARRTLARDKPRALYWFNLAELRLQYDARRCQDTSALRSINLAQNALAHLMGEVIQYAQDQSKVAASLRSLRSRGEIFDGKTSPWWICSHTEQALAAAKSGATLKSAQWLKPENEWWSIKQGVNDILDQNIARVLGR
jgi:hypothetical protein